MSSVVPEGWSKECLGSIFEKISNGTTANQVETEDGESVTRIETISNGYINFEKVGKINASDADKRYLMEQGDILFSNINSVKHIGKVAYFNGEKPLFHGMNLLLFRTNETYAHSKFIFNLMRSDDFRLEISKRVKPAINQASISGGDLKEINFLSPPLPEQKKIASILTSVDEVIENTQKQIDKLQDLKKATMNELLTKGIGHTEFKDSELGRIPKSWEIKTIRELIDKVEDNRGKTPPLSESGIELIEIASISKDNRFLNYRLSKKRVTEDTYHSWFRNGHPKVGDVLVPTVGLIGQCSIVREERGCIAQNLIGLRSSERLLGEFLYWVINSHYVLAEIQRVLMGAVQPSLKVPHLLDVSIPLPPISEQRNIINILHSIEDNVIDAQERVMKTKDLKKSLMQDLLTGKVRVTVN